MDKRIQLILNNVSSGLLNRIEVAIEKNLSVDDFVIKYQENSIIVKEEVLDKAKRIIKSVDDKVNIEEKELKDKTRYVFYLENLDCANCASKVERLCKKNIIADLIVVDFATLKIVIETTHKYDPFDLRMKVQENAELVDPRIEVKEKIKKKETEEISNFRIDKKTKICFFIGLGIFLMFFLLKTILKFGFDYESKILYIAIYFGYIPSYYLLGRNILYKAYKNMINGRIFDENFLMALATIVALMIGLYDEALFVIIFYNIGELCQQYAVNYSRKSIAGLINIRPSTATIEVDGRKKTVDPESVVIGDIICLTIGDKVPLDGVIIYGKANIDEQALTGESTITEVKSGDNILSGSVVIDGTIKMKVTSTYENSMVSKILNMVENASTLKSKSENFISKFAKYYTPTIVICAILIAILLPFISPNYDYTWANGWKPAMRVGMIFMVISCPCALVISIPLGFFGGIGSCSKNGILVKGSNYLEALNKADIVVFDKTGTLTKGNFQVTKVIGVKDHSEEEILKLCAYAEANSNHIIAQSIRNFYGKPIDTSIVKNVEINDKRGIISIVDGKEVMIGRSMFIEDYISKISVPSEYKNSLIVVCDKKVVGYLIIEDEIREESLDVISGLRKLGVNKIVMFTGDSDDVAKEVSFKLGLDEYRSNMNPVDKVLALEELKKKHPNSTICFVGDGINDAPVISSSNIGVAIGGLNNDATMQIADVVLTNQEISKLVVALKIAKKTRKVVMENIIFALLVKFVFLILAPMRFSGSWFATFMVFGAIIADVGVSLIAIINSLRTMRGVK